MLSPVSYAQGPPDKWPAAAGRVLAAIVSAHRATERRQRLTDHFEVEMRRPRELLPPSLLLLLAETPGHGYELMERLKPLGFDWNGPGPIYRELHTLESDGLITSRWDVGASGPGRRVYEITPTGRASLERSVQGVGALQSLLAHYLHRVHQVAAPSRRAVATSRRRASQSPEPAGGQSPTRRLSRKTRRAATPRA